MLRPVEDADVPANLHEPIGHIDHVAYTVWNTEHQLRPNLADIDPAPVLERGSFLHDQSVCLSDPATLRVGGDSPTRLHQPV